MDGVKMDENIVKDRSEIVFVYDVTNANPNGDPDENRPRMDEEVEINLVSDTRLKRTVRDYLDARLGGNHIFTKIMEKDDGTRETKTERIVDLLSEDKKKDKDSKFWKTVETKGKNKKTIDKQKLEEYLKETYIDLRLFGATLALQASEQVNESEENSSRSTENNPQSQGTSAKNKKSEIPSMKWTGPTQFKFGHSLHKVEPALLKGTTVESSGEGHKAGTFTEFWYVPYSLIAFSGIVNEIASKDTELKEEDVEHLLDALWNGTKGLITRSKYGQMPRFLMQVVYNGHFHIGDLDNRLSLQDSRGNGIALSDSRGKTLRRPADLCLDITKIIASIKSVSAKVREVRVRSERDFSFVIENETITGEAVIKKIEDKLSPEIKVSEIGDWEFVDQNGQGAGN